jgi:hypothetical protein
MDAVVKTEDRLTATEFASRERGAMLHRLSQLQPNPAEPRREQERVLA